MLISIISIILLIILSIILIIIYNIKKKHLEKNYKQEYFNNYYQEFEAERHRLDEEFEQHKEEISKKYACWLSAKEEERNNIERSLIERKKAVEEIIEQLENRQHEAELARQKAINNEKEKIDIELEGYKKLKIEQLNSQIDKEFTEKRNLSMKEYAEILDSLNNLQAAAREELTQITSELEEYKKKQAAYNAEILRRRQIEEQQDFYRVLIDNNAISDMQILLSIREKLISHEYIAKPANEMIKRVLNGRAPSGIYKITRLKTGEVYIGKSTDVKNRFTNHIKTAYGIGTIAHSILHTTIRRDGIENFTFELLEEVPKDKLTEREKYWITFYDSKNYGLNERNG